MSVAVPVRVLMELASMVPDVLPSSVLRTDAAREVSVSVTGSLPRPETPLEA